MLHPKNETDMKVNRIKIVVIDLQRRDDKNTLLLVETESGWFLSDTDWLFV